MSSSAQQRSNALSINRNLHLLLNLDLLDLPGKGCFNVDRLLPHNLSLVGVSSGQHDAASGAAAEEQCERERSTFSKAHS